MGTTLDLYPSLLGDAWQGVHDRIRRFHSGNSPVHGKGVFRVVHGSNRLSRALAWLVRLPRPGESVDLTIEVSATGAEEQWRRSFAGRPLVTLQSRSRDGMLLERVGNIEVRFRLDVVDGALRYQSVGAAICLGSMRVPLPTWLCPRLQALESAGPEADQIQVLVEVDLPVLGRLIAYQGSLTYLEAKQ
jgi:hypothetical protein